MQKELNLSRSKEERALSGRFLSGGVCALLLQAALAACRTAARPAQTREVRGDAKRNPQLSALRGALPSSPHLADVDSCLRAVLSVLCVRFSRLHLTFDPKF